MKKTPFLSDKELIYAFQDGDQKAFNLLIARYSERLHNYIKQTVKEKELASDIFQDTILKTALMLQKKQYKETGKFAGLLIRISKNLIIDRYRTRKNYIILSKDDEEFNEHSHPELHSPTFEYKAERESMIHLMNSIISELPTVQQEVIYLRFYRELTFREIALYTGVSLNTALGRMRYALKNIRKKIDKEDFF